MTAVGERSHLDILAGSPLSRLRFRDNAAATTDRDLIAIVGTGGIDAGMLGGATIIKPSRATR